MTIEIKMPDIPEISESGTLAGWLVNVGDPVSTGTPIAEIETDKALIEYESQAEGVVGKLLFAAGSEGVPVGATIAILLEEGETETDIEASGASTPPLRPDTETTPSQTAVSDTDSVDAQGSTDDDSRRAKATPRVRKMARELGIDLGTVSGSGPDGRILPVDLEPADRGDALAGESDSAPAAPHPIPHSKMRRAIATRMSSANASIPHFFVSNDIELDALMMLRSNSQSDSTETSATPTINDFFIKAAAQALASFPELNAHYREDASLQFEQAEIAFAVSVDGGLVMPILRNAGAKTVEEIALETRDLADRARSGKLLTSECENGSFSISNLGAKGVKQFSAIINPPQVAILAVGVAEPRPVIRDGKIQSRTVLTCTLSCDHRAIDGETGARFLALLRELLEAPHSLR